MKIFRLEIPALHGLGAGKVVMGDLSHVASDMEAPGSAQVDASEGALTASGIWTR